MTEYADMCKIQQRVSSMRKWETWEIKVVEFYKSRTATITDIAKLLNRTYEEVETKMGEIECAKK